jgi:hypothetical protein
MCTAADLGISVIVTDKITKPPETGARKLYGSPSQPDFL